MRQNGRRDAELTVLPTLRVDARGGQQQLARVDKILVVGIALEAMPARARFEAEETALPGDRLSRVILPRAPRHYRRNKRLDHLAIGDDRFARLDAQRHAFGPQAAAALAFVDFGVDVQCGEQRIKRAGRGMQHKGVIQPLVRTEARLAAQMVILFMDLRRLRETGLLLVNGLGDKNARIVRGQLQQQRRTVGHHRDKLLIAHPRRVEQDVIAEVADFIDHLAGVIDRAVIGSELDHRQTKRARGRGFLWRRFTDEIPQVALIKAALVNTADKAERIARGFKIDRRRSSLNQRPVMV